MDDVTTKNGKKNINWQRDIMPTIKQRLSLWTSQQIKPTLRGLFYILISLNLLENTKAKYNQLSKYTARAREKSQNGGRIDKRTQEWKRYTEDEMLPIDCFADNVRQIIDIDDIYETAGEFMDGGLNFYTNPDNYKVPRWYGQGHYVEVWVEKDAMAGTLDSIINVSGNREVRIVPTRGQESVTFAWENVERLRAIQSLGKKIHIRYFGDLDPSGEAIEKELIEKLTVDPYQLEDLDFKRVGVTNEQRLEFNLIPNTDPETINKLRRDTNRFAFIEKYGLENEDDLFQIEVDALEAIAPEEFRDMVLASVDEFFDDYIYQENLNDRDITPAEDDFKDLVIQKLKDRLVD